MDKVLFVIPPHLKIQDFLHPAFNSRVSERASGEKFGGVLTDMPLGPMSLSSYLRHHLGHDKVQVRVLDLNVELNYVDRWLWSRESFGDYFGHILRNGTDRVSGERWRDFQPNIVGTSVLFSPSYDNFVDMTKVSRGVFPGATLMAGGGIPTVAYAKIFNDCQEIDAIGFAESEKPFVEYLQATNRTAYLEASPCWITREKKDWAPTSFQTNYIFELDEIPFFDYSIVRKEDYSINPALTAYAGVFQKKNNFHYMTSRGCVYRCNFCASHKVNGRTMRYHSVQRVRDDLLRLRDNLGARTVVIQDDHFMGDQARALELINIIGELKLTVVFQNSLTLFALKRPMLEAMRRAGVTQLLLSVESGSARVLREIMHKPLTINIVEQVANDCRDLGIYTDCNILIGNIRETEKDIADCRDFLRSGKCPADWFKIFIATPLVGSEFYDEAQQKGYITGDLVNFDYKKANISTPDLPKERVEHLQYEMNLELNFVHNHNFRIAEEKAAKNDHVGARANYEAALLGFMSAVAGKPDHAFGHHYAGLCYDRLEQPENAARHRQQAMQASLDPFWRKWLSLFPQVKIGSHLAPLSAAAA